MSSCGEGLLRMSSRRGAYLMAAEALARTVALEARWTACTAKVAANLTLTDSGRKRHLRALLERAGGWYPLPGKAKGVRLPVPLVQIDREKLYRTLYTSKSPEPSRRSPAACM